MTLEPALVRRSRQTGHDVLLLDRRDEAPEQPWELVCDAHGYVCGHSTRKLAVAFMATPAEWCELCRFEQEHGKPEAGFEICRGCIERVALTGYPGFGRCGPCRSMSEEEGLLKIPGDADVNAKDLKACINDGRMEAHLFRKLWKRATSIETVEQHLEVVQLMIDELAWIVSGDADITKTSLDDYHRLVADALAEEEGME